MQTSQAWIRRSDGKMECPRHGAFQLPEGCVACNADPSTPDEVDDVGAAVAPPDGCRSLEDHERWYTFVADQSMADAKQICDAWDLENDKPKERNWHAEGIIAKHREVALKANRAAAELANARERRVLVDARERRIRDRARAGAGH